MQCDDTFGSVVRELCKRLDTPFSLAVYICARDDPAALKQLTVDPSSYLTDVKWLPVNRSRDRFVKDYFLHSYAKKYSGWKSGIDTRQVCIGAFQASEELCVDTNRRMAKVFDGAMLPPMLSTIIPMVQRRIETVIGCSPRFEDVTKDCRWGVGATATHRRGTAFDDKMRSRLSCTRGCLPYASLVVSHDLHWSAALLGFVPDGPCSPLEIRESLIPGSVYDTVPKDAFTDRSIAKEPALNGFLQQGVGRFFRRQLFVKAGINLDDQSINQGLAGVAHLEDLSTIDLSSASDTISRLLIWLLLPSDWVALLEGLRSPEIQIEGRWHRLSKFSSMGNAFTFELESLVFWAISDACAAYCRRESAAARAAVSHRVSVYGDDIVIPRYAYANLVECLSFFGFSVNTAKSYCSGYFFESCGKHYHGGELVTPVYQKEELTTEEALIRAYNRLARSSTLERIGPRLRARLLGVLFRAYPGGDPPRVPMGYEDDVGFLTDHRRFSWHRDGHTRATVLSLEAPRYLPANPPFAYAYKLRRPATTSPHPKGWDEIAKVVMTRSLSSRKIWLSSCRV